MKLLISDRDGVILAHVAPYILRWPDVTVLPGAIAALREVILAGGRVAIVTNQSPVARGLVTMEFVRDVNDYIRELVGTGPSALSFHVCPHEGLGCGCRKPRPGMLVEALHVHQTPPQQALMVGDQASDMQAAHAAGIATRIQVTGSGSCPGPIGAMATLVMERAEFARQCPQWIRP